MSLLVNEILAYARAVPEAARERFLSPIPPERQADAQRRFDAAGGRLRDLLTSLYGSDPKFPSWWLRLCERLGELAAARPAELCELDAAREARPEWFLQDHLLGYVAYADRFGGTLAGIAERLPHLRRLGVSYLHLLPFLRARRNDNDGGFAVASFEEVEPALGSMEDLAMLTTTLRRHGISLCADLVLNHVADEHAWARAAMAGDQRYKAFFHVFSGRTLPNLYERTLGQVFPADAPGNFSHVDGLGWVWTTFYPYQWDLNYAHPPVFAAIAEALLGLANRGVEVFRLDAAPYLWKRLGTSCVNLPEVHLVLAALRAVTELVAPATLLKAEAIVPAAEVVGYFGSNRLRDHECHLAYHNGLMAASWAALAEGHAGLPAALLDATQAPPPHAGWATYVRCHDDIVWGALRPDVERIGDSFYRRIGDASAFLEGRRADGFGRGIPFQAHTEGSVHGTNGMTAALLGLPPDPADNAAPGALRRFALMYGLTLWTGAVPLLYMGDEFGQDNNCDPADARQLAADGRWLQRPRFDMELQRMAEAGLGTPGQVYALLQTLLAARRDPALDSHALLQRIETHHAELLVLRRGEHALAVFHFGREPLRVHWSQFGAVGWRSLLDTGAIDHDADEEDARTLAPWTCVWRVRRS